MEELLNDPETIKKFKLLHHILLSNGVNRISNDFYIDYDGNVDYHFSPWTGKGNAHNFLPDKMFDFLDNFFDTMKDNVLDSLEANDESRATVSCEYSTTDKTFTIEENIQTMGYESSSQEFEIDEKELLEDMVQWKEDGKLKIRVDFNGGGDSGYLEGDFSETRDGVPTEIEDWCYNQLSDNFGGWEINEGSDGQFIFDFENRTIHLEHTFNTEENESETLYEENFS